MTQWRSPLAMYTGYCLRVVQTYFYISKGHVTKRLDKGEVHSYLDCVDELR